MFQTLDLKTAEAFCKESVCLKEGFFKTTGHFVGTEYDSIQSRPVFKVVENELAFCS